ncbi:MAG TPA: DUF2786 domain-containing protein [Micromonosporaceae bacterium]|jgi:hypothetical protein|nr:DUF2786 domain-containing protein [Micromonosporaceae bacterium]
MSDAILDKVRKLLAKAEDPACTPAEAEAFTAKAAELIAKYGVDSALLAAADPTVDPVGDLVVEVLAPYALDKCGLLAGVAAALRCQCVRRQGWTGQHKTFAVHLFGHDSDLRRVELLFTSLLVQAGFALGAQVVPGWENVAAYRRSWFAGYTSAIVARLRAAEDRAAATAERDVRGRSVALVLADRGAEVSRRLADTYPRVRTAGPRRLAGSGARHGYEAGRRADIGTLRMRGAGTTGPAIRARP